MDISKASNFERFIYDVVDHNPDKVQHLWQQVVTGQGFDLSSLLDKIHHQFGFVAGRSMHSDRLQTIAQVYAEDGELIDPHTADGIKVARQLREIGEVVVCLETAKAAKFKETIQQAVGADVSIPRPENLTNLEELPQRVTVLDNDVQAVKQFVCTQLD